MHYYRFVIFVCLLFNTAIVNAQTTHATVRSQADSNLQSAAMTSQAAS